MLLLRATTIVEATVELVSLDNIIEWSTVELGAGNVGDEDKEGSVVFTNKFVSAVTVVRGVEVYDTLNVLDKTPLRSRNRTKLEDVIIKCGRFQTFI